MITISFKVEGTQQVEESVYSYMWAEDEHDKEWSSLSEQEKIDYIKEVEADNNFEGIQEKITETEPVITSVTL